MFADLTTPALLLDRARLEHNATRMTARAHRLGVALRPHLKTCKSVDVARILFGSDWSSAAVSTLTEVQAFFEAGIRNIRYTSPFAPDKVGAIATFIRAGCHIEVLGDDPQAIDAIAMRAEAEGITVNVLLEIDVDGYRGGIRPVSDRFQPALNIFLQRSGVRFGGLYAYAGGTYNFADREERGNLIEKHRVALVETAAKLRRSGIDVPVLAIGSSPALETARSLDGLEESCAGVYGFQDLAQRGIGVCSLDDIAVTVLASVVQVNPDTGRIFIDAGGLALAQDRSTADQAEDQGYGLVCDAETCVPLGAGDIIVAAVSQEHGRLSRRAGRAVNPGLLTPGDRVRIMPNHVCMTANPYPGYHVVDGDQISQFWPRVNGWTV